MGSGGNNNNNNVMKMVRTEMRTLDVLISLVTTVFLVGF